MTAAAPAAELDAPYRLAAAAAEAFRRDGCIRLPDVLSHGTLAEFEPAFTRAVLSHQPQLPPMENRGTYGRAFVQVGHLCWTDPAIDRFVRSSRLARIAAELLGCRGVRLYHDQALYKEPGGGHTPWHCDQQYWPLDNPRTVTAWIPLQDTPLAMGPLAFAPRSQHFTGGRDLPIGDESEEILGRSLSEHGFGLREEPFALGEVSFHLGWTYHRASANRSEGIRKAMTVIYMDADTRVAQPSTPAQEHDRQFMFPDVPVGAVADGWRTPVLYRSAG
jgi:ectoine hydroxylase-related dioxygenase (phytanoyl-CoA dioxygenase family)